MEWTADDYLLVLETQVTDPDSTDEWGGAVLDITLDKPV